MAAGDIMQLVVEGTLLGQRYFNTSHYLQTAEHATPEQDLIDTWEAACETSWLAAHPPRYTLAAYTVRHQAGPSPMRAPVQEIANLAGTRTQSSTVDLAPWLCCVVSLRTALAGRSRRGRWFISGGSENDVDQEVLLSTAGQWRALVGTFVDNWFAAFKEGGTSANWDAVVYSRTIAGDPPTAYASATAKINFPLVRTALYSNRSRRTRPI
jgi:hypothetical protein